MNLFLIVNILVLIIATCGYQIFLCNNIAKRSFDWNTKYFQSLVSPISKVFQKGIYKSEFVSVSPHLDVFENGSIPIRFIQRSRNKLNDINKSEANLMTSVLLIKQNF